MRATGTDDELIEYTLLRMRSHGVRHPIMALPEAVLRATCRRLLKDAGPQSVTHAWLNQRGGKRFTRSSFYRFTAQFDCHRLFAWHELRNPRMLTDPETLTVAEAAKRLRVRQSTLEKAIRAGEFPSIQVGRSVRVPTAGFYTFLDGDAQDEQGMPRSPSGRSKRAKTARSSRAARTFRRR